LFFIWKFGEPGFSMLGMHHGLSGELGSSRIKILISRCSFALIFFVLRFQVEVIIAKSTGGIPEARNLETEVGEIFYFD
jgi:hypothetical protein